MLTLEQNRIVLSFESESQARQVMELLIAAIRMPEPELPKEDLPPLPSTILSEERQEMIFLKREQSKKERSDEQAIRNRLSDGLLPFRKMESPPRVPVKNSPRIKAQETGQFAGESLPQKPTGKTPGNSSAP